jgi:hypothetical protein
MPGFVFDTGKLAELAVAVLARDVVLPATVVRTTSLDYRGSGGSVTVRVPTRRTASQQVTAGAPISYTAIDEVPVTVDVEHWFDAAPITDEAATLEITEFSRQVVAPMLAGIVEASEDRLAGAMNLVAPAFGFEDLSDPAKVEADILEAREQLTTADVPAGSRFLAVAPDVATAMLKLDKFSRSDASGSDTALRDAILGRIYGMTVVESNGLLVSSALAYHATAFVFSTLAPAVPEGAAQAAAATEQGISLRVLFDFDPSVLSDVAIVSTFAGAKLLDADRVVRIAEGS